MCTFGHAAGSHPAVRGSADNIGGDGGNGAALSSIVYMEMRRQTVWVAPQSDRARWEHSVLAVSSMHAHLSQNVARRSRL